VKVLFLCHRFPYPPRRGGKIRPFNIVRHFTARGWEVTLLSLVRDREEGRAAQGIAQYCHDYVAAPVSPAAAWARMLVRLPTMEPSTFGYFRSSQLGRAVKRLLRDRHFDLIFVHCSSMAPYVADYRGAIKILDFGDMDSQKWLAYASYKSAPLALGYWLEGRKLERRERLLAADFDLCTCSTAAELQTLRGLGGATASGWFPNGVDSDYFAPDGRPFDPDLVTFVGRMDYYPNQQAVLWFCQSVLPLLQARRPGVRFSIVGAAPSPQIRRLAQQPGIEVTGTVDDVRPYVLRAALSVAPLQIARGTQNKILESLAMGVPVVVSREAAGGVDAVADEHILVADGAGEFARAVSRLLEQPAERARLARAGRERMLSRHTWSASMSRLDGLIAQLTEGRARQPDGNIRVAV